MGHLYKVLEVYARKVVRGEVVIFKLEDVSLHTLHHIFAPKCLTQHVLKKAMPHTLDSARIRCFKKLTGVRYMGFKHFTGFKKTLATYKEYTFDFVK